MLGIVHRLEFAAPCFLSCILGGKGFCSNSELLYPCLLSARLKGMSCPPAVLLMEGPGGADLSWRFAELFLSALIISCLLPFPELFLLVEEASGGGWFHFWNSVESGSPPTGLATRGCRALSGVCRASSFSHLTLLKLTVG